MVFEEPVECNPSQSREIGRQQHVTQLDLETLGFWLIVKTSRESPDGFRGICGM